MPAPLHPHLSDSNKKHLSAAIRAQWRNFEKWLIASKAASDSRRDELFKALEDEMLKSKKDTPPKYHVLLQLEYDAKRADLKRLLDDESTHLAQLEWDRRLSSAGLNAEDWSDISPAERAAVERALGGDTSPDAPLPAPPNNSSPVSIPFTSNKPWPSPHQHHPTQLSSASAASSHPFQFVDPAAFREGRVRDDDSRRFHSDPHLIIDHDDPPRQSDLAGFSLSVSPDRSPLRNPQSSSSASSSQHSSPIFDSHNKHRSPGSRYIGPVLHDDQDTKVEEADFEKFKIEIREKKIWEFHFEAATAGANLARQLCHRSLDSHKVKDILAEHEQGMHALRRSKEDERRAIVEAERAKRQSEIRRRNALHDSAANPWKPFEAKVHMTPDHDLERLPREPTTAAATKPQSSPTTFPDEIWKPKHAASASQDLRVPGAFEQKKQQQSKKTSKASDHTPQSRPVIASGSSTRHDEEGTDKSATPTVDTSKSRRRLSISQAPPEIWRPDGLESQHDASFNPESRWKIPDKREEFWIPGQKDATPPEQQKVTDPLPGSSSSQEAGRNLAQARPAKTARAANGKGKSAWRTQGTTPAVEEPEPVAEYASLSAKSLGKQKQTSNAPGPKPDVESSGSETARDVLSRPRRVSDPPPPSPKIFDASGVKKQNSESSAADLPKQPKSILKKADRKGEAAAAAAASSTPAPAVAATPSKKASTAAETKKRGKAGKKGNNPPPPPQPKPQKPVTVEEVSDEEADPIVSVESKPLKKSDAEPQPSTSSSSSIVEPKPSVPTTTFSHFFNYAAAEDPTPPLVAPEPQKPIPTVTLPPVESRPNAIWYPPQDTDTDVEDDDDDGDDDGGGWSALIRPLEETTNKAKHVRFTPSVLGRSSGPLDGSSIADAMFAFGWSPAESSDAVPVPQSSSAAAAAAAAAAAVAASTQKVKGRARALSEASRGAADAADRVRNSTRDVKGKGKEKVTNPEPQEDQLAWFANQAIESLKGMRSKPASAV